MSTKGKRVKVKDWVYEYTGQKINPELRKLIKKITIPSSVTSISEDAFKNCDSSLYTIKNNLKYVKANDNPYCILIEASNKNLSTYQINPNTKYIAYGVFESCKRLTTIKIPNSVTSIGDSAFASCSSLRSITMGNSVINIGDDAFIGCESLKSIEIPNSVTSIGHNAFSHCSKLTNIEIPNSVMNIGYGAFTYCDSLTSIEIPDSVISIGNYAFANCSSLTEAVIGDGITSIGFDAFEGCKSLTSVTIGDSVTSIGDSAFRDCKSLKSIQIPDSVKNIAKSAFWGCTSLTINIVKQKMYKIDNLTMEDLMFIDYCIFRYKQRLEDEAIETKMYINKATKENDTDSYKVYAHMLETKQASIIECDHLSNILQSVKTEGVKNV